MPVELFATLALQRVLDRLDLAFSYCDLAFLVTAYGRGHGHANEEDTKGIACRSLVLCFRYCSEVLLFLDEFIAELLAALALVDGHRDVYWHDSVRTLCAGREGGQCRGGKD